MSKAKGGMAVRFVAVLITDVLNPLFIISLALFVSLGYILTLLMPVAIEIWQAVFWIGVFLPLMGLLAWVYARWKQGVYAENRASWRMILPVIPLLILAPMLYGEAAYPSLQVRDHGDIYPGYTHQLLYGATPVENVFVAGHPANYPWLWHAYLAAVTKVTSLHPLRAAEIINTIAIFSGLLWIGRTLAVLKLAKPRTFYLGLAVILVYFSVNATGILTLIAYLADGNAMPDNSWDKTFLQITLLEGADRRLHAVLSKISFTSATTPGLAVFSAAFYVCVRILKDKIDLPALVFLSACGIAALGVREFAALYIAVALLGGLAVAAGICLIGRRGKARICLAFWHELESRVSPMTLLLWFAFSLVLSLPLLKYQIDVASAIQSPVRVEFLNTANIKMIAAADLLLIPLFALQCVFVLQKRDSAQSFAVISVLIAFLLASSLLLPRENQYKAVYLLTILLAVSALFALRRLQQSSRPHWRRVGWMIAAAWFILVCGQTLYASYYYLSVATGRALIQGFEYDGAHLKYEGEFDDRAETYYWIRDSTPPDSIIVLPLEVFKFTNLLHERLLYVKKSQSFYTEGIEAYDERVNHLAVFYDEDAAMDDYLAVRESMARTFPERPIYAIVKDEEVSPAVMRRRGARLVYEHAGDGVNVYWLNPNDQG